jgi:hypothetical protein
MALGAKRDVTEQRTQRRRHHATHEAPIGLVTIRVVVAAHTRKHSRTPKIAPNAPPAATSEG